MMTTRQHARETNGSFAPSETKPLRSITQHATDLEQKIARLEHALAKRWLALTEAKRIIAGLLPADPVEDCNEWNDGNTLEAREWLAKQETK